MSLLNQQRRETRLRLAQIASRSTFSGAIARSSQCLLIDHFLHSNGVQALARYEILSRLGENSAERRWQGFSASTETYRLAELAPATIRCRSKEKPCGGHRSVCRLPSELKMWHLLSKKLLTALHSPGEHAGDWLGRGRDDQIRKLAAAIVDPKQHVVVADIRSAFSSVNFDALYDLLPLPTELVARALDPRRHNVVISGRRPNGDSIIPHSGADKMAPVTGILEGSPASNAIFSVLLDDLPDHVIEGITCFTYCDNIILVAPDRERALEAKQALAEYLNGHPAGPFYLRADSYVADVIEGFDYLGYRIAFDPVGGSTRVDLSNRNWIKLQKRHDQNGVDDASQWLRAHFQACSPQAIENATLLLSNC